MEGGTVQDHVIFSKPLTKLHMGQKRVASFLPARCGLWLVTYLVWKSYSNLPCVGLLTSLPPLNPFLVFSSGTAQRTSQKPAGCSSFVITIKNHYKWNVKTQSQMNGKLVFNLLFFGCNFDWSRQSQWLRVTCLASKSTSSRRSIL